MIKMNYLVVNKTNHVIENVIVWDGESEYDPGGEFIVVPANGQNIGDTYDNALATA